METAKLPKQKIRRNVKGDTNNRVRSPNNINTAKWSLVEKNQSIEGKQILLAIK
jgi:hypothetical protein